MRAARPLVALGLAAAACTSAPANVAAPGAPRAARPTAVPVAAGTRRTIVIGHSVRGLPIRAIRLGAPHAPHVVLVVGIIHGNEPAGIAVIDRLLRATPPPGVDLWLIRAINPDGYRAGTRQNARGVDLNRNFPYRWKPYERPWDPYYAGPRAASEPETRAAMRFILRIRPELSIWYHQHEHEVIADPGDLALERRYAKLVGLRFDRHYPFAPGRATYWQHRHVRGSTAFVVEFGSGSLKPRVARRHARAVLALARLLAAP